MTENARERTRKRIVIRRKEPIILDDKTTYNRRPGCKINTRFFILLTSFKCHSWSILLDYISKEDSSSNTSNEGGFEELKESGILLSAAVLGVPVGGYLLSSLSPLIIRLTLGLTLISYGVFNLLTEESEEIEDPEVPVVKALGAGFLAGVLGGTVSEPGPPVVVYSSFRSFEPAKTRR